jgi:exodeoxyribonuclease VIII
MEPGIYTDVPFDDYLQWDCVDGTLLCRALQEGGAVSMKHLHGYITGRIKQPESKDLAFGSAMHTRLLEPDKFGARHPIAGQCQAVLKSGNRTGQPCQYQAVAKDEHGSWLCKVHAPEGSITPPGTITSVQAAKVEELAKEIRNHKVVRLFRASGGVETSFVWDQDVTYWIKGEEHTTKVRMKGRVDKDIPKPLGKVPPLIVDLKKVQVGQHTDEAFGRSIEKYHYDVKAAIYVDGLESLDGVRRQFVWLAVEDSWPFDVHPIQADDETLDIGRFRYNELLTAYAAAHHVGYWPGISSNIHRGGLPEWVRRRYRS